MSELANKILDEADWSGDQAAYAELLDLIVENPKQVGRAYPPLGYEEVLLKKIRRKTQPRFTINHLKIWSVFSGTKLGWALSVLLLGSTIVSTWRLFTVNSNQNGFAHNAIQGIIHNSERGEVKRWLASLGAATPMDNMEVKSLDLLASDPFVVAFELSNKQLEHVVEKFSQDVRKSHND